MRSPIGISFVVLMTLCAGCQTDTGSWLPLCCEVVLESDSEQIVHVNYPDKRNVKVGSDMRDGKEYWSVVVKYDGDTRLLEGVIPKDGRTLRIRNAVLTTTKFGRDFEDLHGQHWKCVHLDDLRDIMFGLPPDLPQTMVSLEGQYVHTGEKAYFIEQDNSVWERQPSK